MCFRSVHGYADTNLESFIDNLKKQKKSLCAHKGLIPGTTNQTYTLSLSSAFREVYNELLMSEINVIIEYFRYAKLEKLFS